MQSSSQAVRAKEDEPFLERFIEAHEGFILRTASRHAGHTVTRSDDEYSVALMAFYEAVKGYDPAGGPFGAYASLVIGRRLADLLAPKWLRIGGYWYPRGGIPIDVFWQTGAAPEGLWLPDQGVPTYRGRG